MKTGEAFAMGEKPTLALISSGSSARMAVAESRVGFSPMAKASPVFIPRAKEVAVTETSDTGVCHLVNRVLSLPAVGSKSFLITIGDRTVGGLTARDQMPSSR
jgi:phosphoribosylformylglycinamidine (FGAM) synthase-like enzyme